MLQLSDCLHGIVVLSGHRYIEPRRVFPAVGVSPNSRYNRQASNLKADCSWRERVTEIDTLPLQTAGALSRLDSISREVILRGARLHYWPT